MLINQISEQQWNELSQNCLSTRDDMAHISAFPYDNQPPPSTSALINFLKSLSQKYLIIEDGVVVGFLNYGQVIPWQTNAFGLVIGKRFTRKGFAKKALNEFIELQRNNGAPLINGFCHSGNIGIIKIMESAGFIKDGSYIDQMDSNTIKYTFKL